MFGWNSVHPDFQFELNLIFYSGAPAITTTNTAITQLNKNKCSGTTTNEKHQFILFHKVPHHYNS